MLKLGDFIVKATLASKKAHLFYTPQRLYWILRSVYLLQICTMVNLQYYKQHLPIIKSVLF